MNKKAQGLPMNTIIIIILTLFVLAGVGIYFFAQFGAGSQSTSDAQCVQMCESIRARMASSETSIWTTIKGTGQAQTFCDSGCASKVDCKVRIYPKDAQEEWKTIKDKSDVLAPINEKC